ncbi:LPS translocon maturation chaperone LptM [Moellerella wisconsensis]|uniref:LPS translocon maturation chaperone LptM n=1 Tax=Moellerella wisconsensis TaxID=158849 RepID=UPI000640C908|nr:hypothetical protein VK86_01930 [Moellerella wisconsensis]
MEFSIVHQLNSYLLFVRMVAIIGDNDASITGKKTMKKQLCGFLALMAVLSLSGCGLKGPLYSPPESLETTHATDSSQTTSSQSLSDDSNIKN